METVAGSDEELRTGVQGEWVDYAGGSQAPITGWVGRKERRGWIATTIARPK